MNTKTNEVNKITQKVRPLQVGGHTEYTMGQSFLEGLAIIQSEKSKNNLKTEKKVKPVPLYRPGGLAFRAIREKLNLTQNEFANLLRISSETLSSWERGINRPRFHSLLGIKASLPVEYAALLKVEDFGYHVQHPQEPKDTD